MPGLPADFLEAWEKGIDASSVERGLLLLALACPGENPERLVGLSIGERDSRLLALRERAFGSEMNGRTACPACGAHLELEFPVESLRVEFPNPGADSVIREVGYEIHLRPADSAALARLEVERDPSAGARRLLARCVVSARLGEEEVPADVLPAEVIAAISERLSRLDPQADVRIGAECPACSHLWQAPVDIASYLWTEIQAWGSRMLREIHVIASAYGWSEAEIVGLGPARRQAYLDLILS